MGKASTAGRLARIGQKSRKRKASNVKIANKKSQKAPKAVRKKQAQVERIKNEKGIDLIKAEENLNRLSWNKFHTQLQKRGSTKKQKNKKNNNNSSLKNKNHQKNNKAEEDKLLKTANFSKFDRDFSDNDNDNESEEEVEEEEDELTKDEVARLQPFSWNTKKEKMAVLSSQSGEWTTPKINDGTVESEKIRMLNEEIVNKDIIMSDVLDVMNFKSEDDNMVADYLNIGLEKQPDSENESIADMDGEEEENMPTENEIENETSNNPMNLNKWIAEKKVRVNKLKLEMADICEKVVQDPYVNAPMLKLMLRLCKDEDIEVAQYAMLSLARVISDILPQYKIGTLEKDRALKKENEQVRAFENLMLQVYRKFLYHTFKISRIFHAQTKKTTERQNPKKFILARCAVKCLSLFLQKCSHANGAKELIKHTIPLMNSPDESVRKQICGAMFQVLSQTPITNLTVECITLICKRIEQRNLEVFPDVIGTFLGLPLEYLQPPDREVEDETEKPVKSKKEKKLEKAASKDLKELDGDIDQKRMYERQRVIIDNIFAIYFCVLKMKVHDALLPVALEGMSKYCHLINVELLLDLVAVVSEKLQKEKKTLPLESKLHCIMTTFKCMSGRGVSIDMDVKEHYASMYQILLQVIMPQYFAQLPLVFTCLEFMFGRSQHIPIERTAAFVKRLATMACHLPPQWSLAALHMSRKLIRGDARLLVMLQQGGGYDQNFDPLVEYPDQANARACCLYELSCLAKSYHPFQKLYSKDLASWSEIPLGLATAKPLDLVERYDFSDGNFRPAVKQGKLDHV